jgi:hypothetical protein
MRDTLTLIALTGEEYDSAANAADGSPVWLRLAPYGDFPTGTGDALQRFTRECARRMVDTFTASAFTAPHRLPVYLGHPDEPSFANTAGHMDTTRYGEVTAVEVRDDGLWGKFDWGDAWARARHSLAGRLRLSPRWAMLREGAGKVFSPLKLISVGLTPTPNIPGTSAANAAPAPQKPNEGQPKMNISNEALVSLLAALGLELATDATDEEANAAVASAAQTAAAIKAERDGAKREAGAGNTALAAANSAAAAERKARTALAVDAAVLGGKITAAERAGWTVRLEAADDFDGTANAMLASQTLKAQSVFKSVDARNKAAGTAADAAEKFNDLVATRQAQTGETRLKAWAATANTSEGKALLLTMEGK